MGEGGNKRKDAPAGGDGGAQGKKKKTGNSGKWMTPHQQAKMTASNDGMPQPGDVGIWITCARRQERRAAKEVAQLFDEYADKVYGIKVKDDVNSDDEDAEVDIEAAIQKEVEGIKSKDKGQDGEQRVFTVMKMGVDCLLFVKTKAPVEPVEFVRRICEDAKQCTDPRQGKTRYVNRFTPATVMGKATEQGVLELARTVLAPHFDLTGKKEKKKKEEEEKKKHDGEDAETKVEGVGATAPPPPPSGEDTTGQQPQQTEKGFTFAIRPTIRNHSAVKRDFIINEIAALINDDRHKVNLTKPDKVILIDIYQTVCSMTVVDSDWEELKRYNITELYNEAVKRGGAAMAEAEAEEKAKKAEEGGK
ncbi:hypothetical protein B0T17DRAFT_544722 [Bombardia bombarda]|uniref:THUMP domain-containing protein n=1 Tax=Bombardia bombarda TaxID=252184 RepID=A0AA39TMG2_9PEZI|nr:hypothetical protein B0T17DRAFT_544722 [Bombardia bombarda]